MPKLKHEEHHHGHQWGLRVGTEIVASTMIGLGLGFFLDRWLDTRPVFLIVFAIFGLAGGFMNLYQLMVVDLQKKNEASKS
ncbi:ATP synthase protein I [Mariprofundus micogutta]|uniref:ATP synthase protein I n=1 Tax=Mariprofundus micogutta TaxID=1921010 RepID=A0A1L8CQP4_9PROT|nr:AtpZ/AtpI family protein [Mariprofundus micogutta]GAV21240.1 ATP synthase protein I [Mariprofundus micogutta]